MIVFTMLNVRPLLESGRLSFAMVVAMTTDPAQNPKRMKRILTVTMLVGADQIPMEITMRAEAQKIMRGLL